MRQRILIPALLIGLLTINAHADVFLGVSLANNRWQNQWVYSYAPEIAISGKWYWISMDFTKGKLGQLNNQPGDIVQSRWSLVPMLKVDVWGPFFIAAGYGMSHTFRQEELYNNTGFVDNLVSKKYFGEARGIAGIKVQLFKDLAIVAKGGVSYIDKNHYYLSASIGACLTIPTRSDGQPRPARPATTSRKMETNLSQDNRQFVIVGSKDLVIRELNAAMEVALLESGMHVRSWDKVRDRVLRQTRDRSKSTVSDLLKNDIVTMNENAMPIDIALEGARILNLDAVIESQLRYSYKDFGSEVTVHAASVRIVQPNSGEILWAREYSKPKTSFAKLKKLVANDIISVLTQAK